MSASKRVDYHNSDQEAPLFCKVKAERSGLFSRPSFHFLWILSAYEVSRSAKLMGTPIQSCTTQWCPPLKSHIKVRALNNMLCHCALRKCLKAPG